MSDWLDKERKGEDAVFRDEERDKGVSDDDAKAVGDAVSKKETSRLRFLKQPKTWVTLFVLAAFLGLAWHTLCYEMKKVTVFDVIHRYDVTVTPQDDGKMLIHYDIDWEVLNSLWDGPLTEVMIGVDNGNCSIVEFGEGIEGYYVTDGTYINLKLDRKYRKGETVNVQLTVLQDKLLRGDNSSKGYSYSSTYPTIRSYTTTTREPDTRYTVSFTPSWFEGIEVESYTFRWQGTEDLFIEHNAQTVEDGWLVWQGSLPPGGKNRISLIYEATAFNNPSTIAPKTYTSSSNWFSGSTSTSSSSSVGYSPWYIWGTLAAIAAVVFFIWLSHQSGGGGGHHYHDTHYGGCASSSCASSCACASCACAGGGGGGCAGGGRAGCSEKGFVYENPYSSLFRELGEDMRQDK